MKKFRGRLLSHEGSAADTVTIGVDEQWIRVWNDQKRYGAWRIGDVACERVTVFRFTLDLDGIIHTFSPEDPGGFVNAIGAVIDLRPTSRFGLGEKVREAKAALAAALAESESKRSSD